MQTSRLLLTFGLFAVLSASACAPALTPSPAAADASATPVSLAAASEAATQPPVRPEATVAPTETALPIVTSRGPDLHATDPATVSLASGGLQLVEFFRFT